MSQGYLCPAEYTTKTKPKTNPKPKPLGLILGLVVGFGLMCTPLVKLAYLRDSCIVQY